MSKCPWCRCDRLMHDGWGCKIKDGCTVSIVHITPNLFAGASTELVKDQETLDLGKALDAEEDRMAELHVRMIVDRVAIDQA